MEFSLTGLLGLAVAVSLLGAAAGAWAAARLARLSGVLGDRSLGLAGLALAAYSLGLVVESLSSVLGLAAVQGPGRPEVVELLLRGRGVLLASPLYMVSYVLLSASLYCGHVASRLYVVHVPLILQLYVDYNLVALVVLAAAAAASHRRYGTPKAGGVMFLLLAAGGHAASVMLAVTSWENLVPISMALRGAAPLALVLYSAPVRRGGGGGC